MNSLLRSLGRSSALALSLPLSVGALGACHSSATLDLVVAPRPVTQQVAADIEALTEASGLRLVAPRVGAGSLTNLDAVAKGEADLAIVPNSVEYRPGVRTVAVLYTGVLHILTRREGTPADFGELVSGARIFAGPQGSVERQLLAVFAERNGLHLTDYQLADSLDVADVAFAFAPIMPELGADLDPSWRFFSLGEPSSLGAGAVVEGLCLNYPQLRPIVIPSRTYLELDHGPVVSVGVDVVLVARDQLDDDTIHDLTEALVTHRRQLSSSIPALFAGLASEVDSSTLTFPLHEGARQYFERDVPGLAERYAELIGVIFSISLASISGLVALSQWRGRRRKDRIDVYYAEVLKVRAQAHALGPDERVAAIAELRAVEVRAFEALIAEDLAADEAFRIFVTLVHDAIAELR